MARTIQEIMASKKENYNDIAKTSGMSYSTIANAGRRDFKDWTINTLNGFALGLGISPATLLNELQDEPIVNSKINFNDTELTIQGIKFESINSYFKMKNQIKSLNMSYIPTAEDIKAVQQRYENSNKKIKSQIWQDKLLSNLMEEDKAEKKAK